jgi:hypothetical protein
MPINVPGRVYGRKCQKKVSEVSVWNKVSHASRWHVITLNKLLLQAYQSRVCAIVMHSNDRNLRASADT